MKAILLHQQLAHTAIINFAAYSQIDPYTSLDQINLQYINSIAVLPIAEYAA